MRRREGRGRERLIHKINKEIFKISRNKINIRLI